MTKTLLYPGHYMYCFLNEFTAFVQENYEAESQSDFILLDQKSRELLKKYKEYPEIDFMTEMVVCHTREVNRKFAIKTGISTTFSLNTKRNTIY